MSIETKIWKINDDIKEIKFTPLDYETRLEEILEKNIDILGLNIMPIGRQVGTNYRGEDIDLLGIDIEGNLSIIELKRDKTPRDVVGQILDYATWIDKLSRDDIINIWNNYENNKDKVALEAAFEQYFKTSLPDELNETYQLIIVASELDNRTERIVNYLSTVFQVPINAIFFKYFKIENNEFITRTWLIDPAETSKNTNNIADKKQEEWNGKDYYVAIGEGESRKWEDCVKYGFISGGGGKWYSQTLKQLYVGARVFAYIPSKGYVGVGTVTETATKADNVLFNGKTIFELSSAHYHKEFVNDDDKAEWIVKVEWTKTITPDKAIREPGMFASQHTACKLRSKFTLNKLIQAFKLEN